MLARASAIISIIATRFTSRSGVAKARALLGVVRGEGPRVNPKKIWQAVLGELQLGISRANFDTWFKDTSIVSAEDDVFVIGVPNAFAREWLDNKYRQNVKQALQRAMGRTVDVRFVTANATVRAAAGAAKAAGPASRPRHRKRAPPGPPPP